LDEPAPGVVWFDAHADFNEPATTTSGYIDGMGVAILTGSAWQGMLATVPGASPVPESRVVLAGARDLDPPEETRLVASQIAHLTADQLRSPSALVEAVNRITPDVTGLYVHLDLDVLDSSVAPVNVYHSANGPDADQINALVATLFETFPVRGFYLGTYDPAFDPENRVPPIALRILRTIAASL
jgi:arginase